MTVSDRSTLPLLRNERHRAPADDSSVWSTVADAVRSDKFRVRSLGSIAAWIAVGCAVSMFTGRLTAPPAVQDYTHGGLARHAVENELDLLSTCSSTGQPEKPEIPAYKGKGWMMGGPDPEVVLSTLPAIQSLDELPKHWDWRDYNGTGISLTTSVLNQMSPKACGSCWAFATVSALSDRIRIANFKKYGKLGPEVLLSPQVLLDCGMRSFGSCRGGDPRFAHQWIHENGIVDWTCNPYIASHPSWMGGGDCAATQCHTCALNGSCYVVENPKKYHISEYGTLNFTSPLEFQLQAMNEIYHRGPIVVSMYSLTPEYRNHEGGYILRDDNKYPGTTHVVSLVGWGEDEATGVKYWIVRNSDGTNWGDDGFFRAERGTNTYNLEIHAAYAVPVV